MVADFQNTLRVWDASPGIFLNLHVYTVQSTHCVETRFAASSNNLK